MYQAACKYEYNLVELTAHLFLEHFYLEKNILTLFSMCLCLVVVAAAAGTSLRP